MSAAVVLGSGCAALRQPPMLAFERSAAATQFTTSARGVDRISIEGGQADITVDGTGDTVIRVEVALRSRDSVRIRRECLPSVRLDTSTRSGVFTMTLTQDTRDRCGERWHVHLPRRLAAQIHIAGGTIEVNDLHGGLEATARSNGNVRGLVAGPVQVEVGVGNIDLRSVQPDYGSVELESRVGDVSLTLRGYEIPDSDRHGSGHRVRMTGKGRGTFRATSRVGKVTVRIGN